uniref:Uncharacterized protein n=1 Tax=Lepeophtheirus salmonis TaxID=72036 RepID=A0A0K2V634_LEPSM
MSDTSSRHVLKRCSRRGWHQG